MIENKINLTNEFICDKIYGRGGGLGLLLIIYTQYIGKLY